MAIPVERILVLLVALLEISFPVCKGGSHHSTVDVIEWMGKGPEFFEVIDLEG